MDEITLEWAADYAGFSKYHFSRLFKDYTDVTFADYLMHRRMQAAKVLLSESASTVTEIAFQTGFNNLTSFTRSFRNSTGMTPSEYRQIRLEQAAATKAAEEAAKEAAAKEAAFAELEKATETFAEDNVTHQSTTPIPHSVFTTSTLDGGFEDEY
jgi:AraC-like DNA-binding protein